MLKGIKKLITLFSLYYLWKAVMKQMHQSFFMNEKIYPITIWNINKFCKVNKSTPWMSISFKLRGYIEKWTSLFFIKNINKQDVFLDIWANIWYFSLICSELVGEKGKVYAFEPVKNNIKSLEENININNISNIKVYDFALGNDNTNLNINIDPDNSAVNSILVNKWKSVSEKIKIKKFDDLEITDEKIKFLKIDVEWYEYEVLKWMENFIKRKNNLNIVMEFSPLFYKQIGIDPDEFIEYIYKFWFDTYKILSNGDIKNINLYEYTKIYQMNILLKKDW